MKKSMKYIMTIIYFLGLLGCTDLEEHPVGILAPEGFFKSVGDVEAAIFSGYGKLSSINLYGADYPTGLQLKSDMVDIGDRGTSAERQQVNDFNVDAGNGIVRKMWPIWFEVISTENAAIFGAEQIESDETTKNKLIAEARFVRGMVYYQLVRCFGDLPYLGEFVTDPEAVKTLSKTPASEIYQKIIADFLFAKENLPDQQPGDVRSRPTKGAAASFLASVYLTLEDYQSAATEAKWVISNKSRFNYGLASDYQDLFNAEKVSTQNEPIFVIDFLSYFRGPENTSNDQLGRRNSINRSATGINAVARGFSALVPSMDVYLTWDGRDYRKSVSLDTIVGFIDGEDRPYTEWYVPRPAIAKWSRYPGPNAETGGIISDYDYIVMRYAEVLLIAAEAISEVSGPTAEAIGYVNEVRGRARNWAGTMTDFPENIEAGMSKDEFIDLVLDDRRLELAFEFKRWFDIKRRKLGNEVFKGPNSLEPHSNFDPDRDYLFPLPGAELDRYPNLLPQNPGY